ncbi:Imm8 family immunity protein [Citromicrobium bathyomarinum]|uniref:Imm8 family immunity protein n=1 Tax=Citromicrobium bathyomarinum TaxID=72174 RepID=UPI003159CC65
MMKRIPGFRRSIIRPELRSLTGQTGEDVSDLFPISGCFNHTLLAEIGPQGMAGADEFQFEVCSPEWLERELDSYLILPGGPRLITKRFEPKTIEEYVQKRLLHAVGADWASVAAKLGQWSRWEFDNYQD